MMQQAITRVTRAAEYNERLAVQAASLKDREQSAAWAIKLRALAASYAAEIEAAYNLGDFPVNK